MIYAGVHFGQHSSNLLLPVFHVFLPSTECMESIKCLEVCSVYVLIEIAPDRVCLSDSPLIWYQPPVVRCGGSVIIAAQ